MKATITTILIFGCLFSAMAQEVRTYQNGRQESHLCGLVQIADLNTENYAPWFESNYEAFALKDPAKWKKDLKNTQVEIYLGTWCGDSKYWVPRFIKLWDELGLKRSQLKLIALYDGESKYKQGPNGEEAGKRIHRVPTFIFKKNEQEYARIVERPNTDLVTDLAQISLGYPSDPNYRAASYLLTLMENQTAEKVREDLKRHVRSMYRKVQNPGELNTLGYVLLRAGSIESALIVFEINTYLFPYYANTYDSYAEALAAAGRTDDAIKYYDKVLEMDANNKNALEQIEKLRAG